MTFSIMALRIMGITVKMSLNDIEREDTKHSNTLHNVVNCVTEHECHYKIHSA